MARPCPVLLLGLVLLGSAHAGPPARSCTVSNNNEHTSGTGSEYCTAVFYQCDTNSGWVRKSCPAGTAFDPMIGNCNHLNSLTCTQGGTGSCSPNPCLNGGSCTATSTGFFCTCAAGYTGETCSTSSGTPNPCSVFNPCQHGQCVFDQSYRCICDAGYTGLNCSQREPTNYCLSAPCKNGGLCSSTASGFVCQCASGYTGLTCSEPVNYCQSAPCKNGGLCSSTASGFSCQCPSGWTGPTCTSAVVRNDCSSSPCKNGATCYPFSSGGFYCFCRSGYSGNTCEVAPNACASSPCKNSAECVTQGSSFYCACTGNGLYYGTLCNEYNLCAIPGICLNGGSCVHTGNATYTCQCRPGFLGQYCELATTTSTTTTTTTTTATTTTTTTPAPPNYCLSAPCQNGALCSSTASGFVCQCPSGWTGRTCGCPLYPCKSSTLFYLYPDFSSPAHFYACMQGTLTRYACQDRIIGSNFYDKTTFNCVTK